MAFVVDCKPGSHMDYLDGRVLGGMFKAGKFGGFSVPGLQKIEIGDVVEADTVHGLVRGMVVSISEAPMVLIETSTGDKVWWRRDLCSTLPVRKCWTCKLWSSAGAGIGECLASVPAWVPVMPRPRLTSSGSGSECEAWEAKDEKQSQ